jgi:glycosyltransferase involved in cell wall biosynthesis
MFSKPVCPSTKNNRIKILHVITSLNVGGTENVLYGLVKCMDPARFENQVVSMIRPGLIGEKIRALGIPVHTLNMQPGRPSIGALFRLANLIHHEEPDLVQTWLYHADLLGLLAAKITAKPVLWNIRTSNMDMSQYRQMSRLVLKACIQLSGWPQLAIVNSKAGQDFHEHLGYHPRDWILIPNGVDTGQFQPNLFARAVLRKGLGLSSDTILIGLIARFDPMKDHVNFMEAASFLSTKYPDVHYVLAGAGVEPSNCFFDTYQLRSVLRGRFHLLGLRDDLADLIAGLDIASSSSYTEGFPNTIAEAMSCEIPCVVTDAGDSACLVGETGVVVAPRDSQALANGWQYLIDIGAKGRNALGLAARKRIQQYYELDECTRQYERLYESLMPSHA